MSASEIRGLATLERRETRGSSARHAPPPTSSSHFVRPHSTTLSHLVLSCPEHRPEPRNMMQRPRNRQGRPSQHPSADRGRGRGGSRGRGGRFNSNGPSSVPSIQQIVSGAHVSIVLKVDQPTGRQVQGTVADVLTSGNHPRGIKVRLVDGRVGRVQRMATEEEARAGSEGLSNLGRNGEASGGLHQGVRTTTAPSTSRFNIRYRDVREEEELDGPPAGYSLGDLLPPGHPLLEQHDSPAHERGVPNETTDLSSATQVCPVCNEFEGDEIAISHHVNSHFD